MSLKAVIRVDVNSLHIYIYIYNRQGMIEVDNKNNNV